MNAVWSKSRSLESRSVVAVRAALVCCVILIGSGCMPSSTKPIEYSETPKAGVAYLYGQFEVRSRRDDLEAQGDVAIGLRVVCTPEKSYTIRFTRERPFQLIGVSPAACSISEVVFTNLYGDIVGSRPIPMWLFWDQEVEANRAYYVGDFFGVTQEWDSSTQWSLSEIRDEYESTTRLLRAWFPGFAQVPTVDRVTIPAEGPYDPFAVLDAPAQVPALRKQVSRSQLSSKHSTTLARAVFFNDATPRAQ